jgi:hypothetical protein
LILQLKLCLLRNKFIFGQLNKLAKALTRDRSGEIGNSPTKTNVQRVALVFNRGHYDPTRSRAENERYYYVGSVIWARFFYEYFHARCHVTLIDINSKSPPHEKFDLIVGLASKAFYDLSKQNVDALKLLFAVNFHPYERNRIIIDECNQQRLPLILMEMINPFVYGRCIQIASHILLLGNSVVRDSYLLHGINESKITTVSGMVDRCVFRPRDPTDHKRSPGRLRIVYPSGFNGVRKGLLRFIRPVRDILRHNLELELVILGGFDTSVKNLVDHELESVHSRVRYENWLSHDDLLGVLRDSDIVVLLSLEEGRVYSALEAIFCGCMPLLSRQCGIDLPDAHIVNKVTDEREIYIKLSNIIHGICDKQVTHRLLVDTLVNDWNARSCERFLDEHISY